MSYIHLPGSSGFPAAPLKSSFHLSSYPPSFGTSLPAVRPATLRAAVFADAANGTSTASVSAATNVPTTIGPRSARRSHAETRSGHIADPPFGRSSHVPLTARNPAAGNKE